MTVARDAYLALAVRKQNLLRLEHKRRTAAASVTLRRLLLRALLREASLSLFTKTLVAQRLHALSTWSRVTKHRTRCLSTGRARQARRRHLLARMQLQSLHAEGMLPSLQHSRR